MTIIHTHAWLWWFFPSKLTFRFTADLVEVQGHAYGRDQPIAFTNKPTEVVGVGVNLTLIVARKQTFGFLLTITLQSTNYGSFTCAC